MSKSAVNELVAAAKELVWKVRHSPACRYIRREYRQRVEDAVLALEGPPPKKMEQVTFDFMDVYRESRKHR